MYWIRQGLNHKREETVEKNMRGQQHDVTDPDPRSGKVPLKYVPIICSVGSLVAGICTREGYNFLDWFSGRVVAKQIDLQRMTQSCDRCFP